MRQPDHSDDWISEWSKQASGINRGKWKRKSETPVYLLKSGASEKPTKGKEMRK